MMSRTELSRLRVMIDLADGRTRVEDAAALMGLQRRQVYRWLDAFRAHGLDALISKRRGKPSNRSHGAALRQTCLAIAPECYEDHAGGSGRHRRKQAA
jgi:transposase